MKKRVQKHISKREVHEYVKLMKRLENFEWTFGEIEDTVTFAEYCRKYKKMIKNLYGKTFRSYKKAMRYDDICWINHRGKASVEE